MRSKIRYENWRSNLVKMLLSLEPEQGFLKPVLVRNGKRDRLKRSYVNLIEITFAKTFFFLEAQSFKKISIEIEQVRCIQETA